MIGAGGDPEMSLVMPQKHHLDEDAGGLDAIPLERCGGFSRVGRCKSPALTAATPCISAILPPTQRPTGFPEPPG